MATHHFNKRFEEIRERFASKSLKHWLTHAFAVLAAMSANFA